MGSNPTLPATTQAPMVNLFDVVPATLFNPLVAQGAPTYASVLLTLFAETQRQQQPLSRELAVNLVADLLATQQYTWDINPDQSESMSLDEADDLHARAGNLLRYLTRCGWLRIETQSDFTQTYILPDYAFRLLNVLHEISSNQAPSLPGLICSIHDLLQAAVHDGTAHFRLPEAYRQTMTLVQGLKELQHTIGLHIEQVLNQLKTSAILKHFFLNYRNEILDRAYHQLRTTDHVSRFRPGVLEALTQLEDEQQIHEMARRMRASGHARSTETAIHEITLQLRYIREQFEGLDRALQAIDVRHSQFVDSAVRIIELHLMAETTSSGQLHTIISHLLNNNDTDDTDLWLQEDDAPLINLFAMALLDTESLAPPARPHLPFVPDLDEPLMLSEIDVEAARTRTRHHINRSVSRERVRRFVLDLLQQNDQVHGADLPLQHADSLSLLIYLRHYGDGSLGYIAEPLDDQELWVERAGIGFRDFVLRRTEPDKP
ncbi:MAG: hypothetical protein HC837_05640 [Chloroflexaceae bacterium]|nr:hypothetical protein [Chloroflexaceae bacterium]